MSAANRKDFIQNNNLLKAEQISHNTMPPKAKKTGEKQPLFSSEKAVEEKVPFLTLEKKILLLAIVGISLLVWGTFPQIVSLFSEDTVLVFINGVEITEAELQAEIAKLPSYYVSTLDNETIRKAVLDQLIAKELLLEQVKLQGMTVAAAEIDVVLTNLTINAQLTEEEFKEKLAEQGLTLEKFKELVEEQLAINKVIEQNALANIQVTEEELEAYYEEQKETMQEVRASHILICYQGAVRCEENRTKEEAQQQAKDIIQQIKEGREFSDLAKEYSDDPSAAFNAGDLGWFKKGQMVGEFEDAAFAMNIGELSEQPVETVFGYHVIETTDKKESYLDFKEDVLQILLLEKQREAVNAYLKALEENATIEYADETLQEETEEEQ